MTVTDLAAVREAKALETLARLRTLAGQAATEDEAREVAHRIRTFIRKVRAARWDPYPWQHPHVHPPGWVSLRAPGKNVCDDRCTDLPRIEPGVHEAWLQRGGRGTGKTEGAAHYVNAHVEGPPCDPRVPGGHRVTIVAPTQPDAVSSCVTGVTGLQAINPGINLATGREGTLVRWPNGSVGRVLGAHTSKDVERARAWTNVCLWWVEEAAAMNWLGGLAGQGEPEGMLDQAPFTLRLGPRPHLVITTTPRNRPEVTALIEGTPIQTWGRTEDADRLPEPIRASYEGKYRGTTLGRQELDGEQIKDVVGALWIMRRPDPEPEDYDDDRPGIDNDRVPGGSVTWTPHTDTPVYCLPPPEAPITLDRTVVAVDPPGGATECGIIGLGVTRGQGYVVADLSIEAGPDTWGRRAVQAYLDLGAEGIALEKAYGGNMTDHTIATAAEAMGVPTPPIFHVPTKVGKKLRAEPIVALSQQHRIHHVGHFPALEGEQTTWVEGDGDSPNRLDAYVHAATHLMVRAKAGTASRPTGRRVRSTSATWSGQARRG